MVYSLKMFRLPRKLKFIPKNAWVIFEINPSVDKIPVQKTIDAITIKGYLIKEGLS